MNYITKAKFAGLKNLKAQQKYLCVQDTLYSLLPIGKIELEVSILSKKKKKKYIQLVTKIYKRHMI